MYSKRRIIVRSGLAVGAAAACFLGVDSIHRSMQTQARLTYDHSRFAAHMAQTSPYMDLALPVGTQGSANWSGYIANPNGSNGYTSATGNWVVPTISGADGAMAAQWIGLGGVENADLLQIGTTEQMMNGQEEADVFWEKLPAAAHSIMSIPVGSSVAASIEKGGGSDWVLSIQVKTPSGQTENKNVSVSISNQYAANIGTSAEWISEDPSTVQGNLYPLANAGTVQFTNATVDGQPISASGNSVQPVAMVDQTGNVLISPSNLGSDGESFSTSTLNTTSSAAGNGYGIGAEGGWSPGWSQWSVSGYGGRHHQGASGWSGWTPGGSWSISIPTSAGNGYAIQFSWSWQ
ncbi:G1 family glutamic endopeptidase [Alicyclobacillus sacchari]|nr:G1 family glutamic endopeptidase [Alicyclobacillus sacchari]